MSSYRLAQINFSRLRCPLSDPKMAKFLKFLQSVNTLAEASPGFVWRLDEQSATASGSRAFPNVPPGTTLVNLSVWKSVGSLQRYASLGKDGGVMDARQSWFNRFEGRWIVLWWVPEGSFPEVADGLARFKHLRRHGTRPTLSPWVTPTQLPPEDRIICRCRQMSTPAERKSAPGFRAAAIQPRSWYHAWLDW